MRLVPPLERFGRVESAAERRVAGLLEQIDLGEPATCFYSVHLPHHEYKRMSEIDFLIVMDGFVLVVEVKGGRLGRRDGIWTFTDRYGHVHEKREGPFQQARSAMFALEKDLRARAPQLAPSFGAVVVTPDQMLDADAEWDPAECIGGASMSVSGLRDGLLRAVKFWRARQHAVAPGARHKDLVALLRPDFDRIPKLSLTASAFEEEYVALAAEQYAMLAGSELNDRVLCVGGAGSGKTLLAVETARRAAGDGARVLLTCRSPGVVELMTKSLGSSSVDCVLWSDIGDRDAYEVLVVDEAQDLLNVEDWLRMDGLVAGGLDGGRWRLFCDPNNQANVVGKFDAAVYEDVRSRAAIYRLPFNCRNTATIVTQTQLITGADLGIAKAGEGPQVEYVRTKDDAETASFLDQRLRHLLDDEIHPDDIVVLTMRDVVEDSAALSSRAWARGRLLDAERRPTERGHPRLVTTQAFKGLEAAHVLVIDVDDLAEPMSMARLYVAMTRPRVSLWVALGADAWDQVAREGGK